MPVTLHRVVSDRGPRVTRTEDGARLRSAPIPGARPRSALGTSSKYNIQGKLKCILSRSTPSKPTTPVLNHAPQGRGRSRSAGSQAQAHQIEYNKVQKSKRKRSSQLGHDEEKRIMRILHNLQSVEATKTPALLREELTQLYIKPLPLYIQDKLKQHEERQMSRSAILFEEFFQNNSLEENDNTTSSEKIKLPDQKPLITSRWQQKMLTKLDKMDHTSLMSNGVGNSNHGNMSSSYATPQRSHLPPHLNRQLQVQGQGSGSAPVKPASISRYKPPLPSAFLATQKPRHPSFPYADPLPDPPSSFTPKEGACRFEERILELERMERDSVLLERASKARPPGREVTTRLPPSLTQPKYLDSTAASTSRTQASKRPGKVSYIGNANGQKLDRRKSGKEFVVHQKRRTVPSKVAIASKS